MVQDLKDKNKNIETIWEISFDGWYPYCKLCNFEPEWKDVYENGLAKICPNCGATMTNADALNNGCKWKAKN